MADTRPPGGKAQPWRAVWPPAKHDLLGVVESKGEMLLLDGTGGSGTSAVPNAVYLPPKVKASESKEEDDKGKEKPEDEAKEMPEDEAKERAEDKAVKTGR